MKCVAKNGVIADSGSFAPGSKINSSDSLSFSGKCATSVEQRLARRLWSAESCIFSALQERLRKSTSADENQENNTQQLPRSWKIIAELLEKPTSRGVNDRLERLLRCLETAAKAKNASRVAIRDYVSKLQLYALLPVYLRVDQCSFESALDESISFALQAISLIDLDRGLESELFELLSESTWMNHPPSVALEATFKVDLCELANAFASEATNDSTAPFDRSCRRISKDRCIGYWSIVQQWSNSTTHLRIPSQLSIGKVLWPKVREHWTRLSLTLSENQTDTNTPTSATIQSESNIASAGRGIASDDDFIEIRNSNDPQLAKTLDIQLQRCREAHGSMSLVVVKVVEQHEQFTNRASEHRLPQWQETAIEHLRAATDGQSTRGFQSQAGELTLVIDDLDRNEVSAIMREVLEVASQSHDAASSMIDNPRIPIVCGIACVSSPSKRFQIDQLIHSAWRCLDAAKLQGPGTVKSIEVF